MTPSGPVPRETGTRGQSSPLAYILVLSIVLVGTVAILTLGTSALQGTQGQSELQRAEHAMTLFDSRTAMVALGASQRQTISFGQDSGSFETRPDSGWIAIEHHNFVDPPGGRVETIYNESFGAFVYSNGNTEIAYQGGGVWRTDGDGAAQMISPPEFHYREATLTLPVIRVVGGGVASGNSRATVTATRQARPVYPDENPQPSDNAPYEWNGGSNQMAYDNPISNGSVYAWIHSEYYRGWASYFRERTAGEVTVYDNNQTVRLNLLSLGGAPGEFAIPGEHGSTGESVEAEAMADGHPVSEFSLSLKVGNNFNNAHWSLWSDDGTNELEFHLVPHDNCKGNSDFSGDVTVRVFYHNTSTGEQEEWMADIQDTDYAGSDTAIDVDCSTDTMHIDFASADSSLTYQDFSASGNDKKWAFPDSIDAPSDDDPDIDQHSGVDPGEIDNGDQLPLELISNHYLSRMPPTFDIRVQAGPGNSNRIDEDSSVGELRYTEAAGDEFLAYLHVTENDVEVDFG